MEKTYINVTNISVRNHKIVYRLDCSPLLKKYFTQDTYFVEYGPDVDISNVDKSILVIPMLSVVVPIAWAVGADIVIDSLDDTYFRSLNKIEKVFREFFPLFSFATKLQVKNIVTNKFGGKRSAVLFSGGLDSTVSYVRNKDHKPDLIPVLGWAPRLHDLKRWNKINEIANCIAVQDAIKNLPVITDISYINTALLDYEFRFHDNWYSYVAHGLALTSLCAPVTAVRAIGAVYIASSNPIEFTDPWGSHPLIDNNVAWADVAVIHDAYPLSRQEKIEYISAAAPEYLANLMVCYEHKKNCGRCGKCLYTIAGLVLQGVDPRECNFNLDKNVFQHIKKELLSGEIQQDATVVVEWLHIQKHIPEQINNDLFGSKEFFTWFRKFDLRKPKFGIVQRLRKMLHNNLPRQWQAFKENWNIESFRYLVWLAKCYRHIAFAKRRRPVA
jgi:hypothetical protein